jgi:pyridoxine 4-dehydrogenase
MIQPRDEGLIEGVGLSNVTREHLLYALERTHVACVQNPLNLVDRASRPVLDACTMRGDRLRAVFPAGRRPRLRVAQNQPPSMGIVRPVM